MSKPVRFSHLRAYGRSPLHGRYAREQEMVPTAAMELGTAVHAMVFNTKQVLAYTGTRRGKDWDAFSTENASSHILPAADYARAVGMRDAVLREPLALPVLEGIQEKTVSFQFFGLECRVTPDVCGAGYVTELKTCHDANPMRFQWHSLRMAYHAQLRFQQIGTKQESGIAYLVAVESKPPFAVQVYRVTDEALKEADKLLTSWMERLKTCEASGAFPAYSQTIWPLDVPRDDDLTYGEDEDA